MVLGQGFCICRCAEKWERERKKQVQCTGSRIVQLFKVKMNWFERLFLVTEIMSESFPACIPRKPTRRWIPIQPLNMGDKGVAKIKWRHALVTEASRACLRRVNTYCCDLTWRNKAIGEVRRGYQNPPFLPRSWKARFWGLFWGPIDSRGTIHVERAVPMAQNSVWG